MRRITLGILIVLLITVGATTVSGQPTTHGALLVQLDGSSRAFTDLILGRMATVTAGFSLPQLETSGTFATLDPWSRRDLPAGTYTMRVRLGEVSFDHRVSVESGRLTVVVVDSKLSSLTEEHFDLDSLILPVGEAPAIPPHRLLGFPALYDEPPSVISWSPPEYSPAARSAEIEGIVVVKAKLGPDGAVVRANVIQSVPALDEAALASVRSWRFSPAKLLGQAVPADVIVPVLFRLEGG